MESFLKDMNGLCDKDIIYLVNLIFLRASSVMGGI